MMFDSLRSIAVAGLCLSETSLAARYHSQDGKSTTHNLYKSIAGYQPVTQVSDQAAIDHDQDSIEWQVDRKSNSGFVDAAAIYQMGGHSLSYADVHLSRPLDLDAKAGTEVVSAKPNGDIIIGVVYGDFEAGDRYFAVQYKADDDQEDYAPCHVGALALVGDEETSGCLAPNGTITVDGHGSYEYSYSVSKENRNGRTIASFSSYASFSMRKCETCPYYEEYTQFYDYYGVPDYAHQWILAALEGRETPESFSNGHADFSGLEFDARAEIVAKGTAYMSIFMYALRAFEHAIDDCEAGCEKSDEADDSCSHDPAHSWDEGVAYYTGSLEGEDGTGDGTLMYTLADYKCKYFKTCGKKGHGRKGTSKVNYDLLDLFKQGQNDLLAGNCKSARQAKDRIFQLAYVPLIQGALGYAYEVEKFQGGEVAQAKGAAYAAAILPKIYACNLESATLIYDRMRVGAVYSDGSFGVVKAAFESTYPCLGIRCADVGGYFDKGKKHYYQGASPCTDRDESTFKKMEEEMEKVEDNPSGLVLGIVLALTALGCAYILYIRRRGKKPFHLPVSQEIDSFNEQDLI